MMLSVLIYAYSHGVRSSRAIERLCGRDAGYRFVVGEHVPDHTVIARSQESSGALAKRFGVSAETIRKWRKHGPEDCLDHSAKPHKLPWKATDEERAMVCALRRATNFALDDLTFVVHHFLPHLNRDSVWRILRAEGLSRRPPPPSERPK